jgi:hypothetical protein
MSVGLAFLTEPVNPTFFYFDPELTSSLRTAYIKD